MEGRQRLHPLSISAIAGLIGLTLVTGGVTTWFTWQSLQKPPTSPSQTSTVPNAAQPFQTSQATQEKTAQIYWLQNSENRIALAPQAIALNPSQPEASLKQAIHQLLAGPSPDDGGVTTIPANTRLLNLAIDSKGIHIDLSEEFTRGGGSASMSGRLAQILYTATSLDPQAQVWVSVEGRPLEVLGGEGVMVDQPLTRQNFEQDFSL